LKQFAKPGATVAVVSDSWNIYNAVEKIWGEQLKQEVIDSGANVVIRPDSGEPVEVVSKVAQILGEKFGTTTNSKGYKVLKNVRIIQGDGVNQTSINQILKRLKSEGFSASNVAFGIGGSLLQKIDRDTLKFAYKCSAITRGGELIRCLQQPVGDAGKISKRGRLDLIRKERREFETVKLENAGQIHLKIRRCGRFSRTAKCSLTTIWTKLESARRWISKVYRRKRARRFNFKLNRRARFQQTFKFLPV
jgi:nicotinamide phosphoribosyltransferase